ncbi:acetate--CoA ligase family protein [Nocardia sp. NBC_01009]|uniref:acetate--CoA ligase family protein n=1 Tax=Nocardia sp. NBC_01009 TaxID=2975996 RepID=UPI003868420D|nr:acetate--CoA ligase family protein [Nocardia sp. NBC_01009]
MSIPVDERLRVFRDPRSVAVVGASADESKWGYWLASGALRGRHRRRVELVNRRFDTLLGSACAPSLSALDATPELAVLSVPAAQVAGVVAEALEMGVRGFLGITAGIEKEAELAEAIRAAGARLVGANSLGIYDAVGELELCWGRLQPGSLAIVSQSGQLGSEIATLGARRGLGVSRFVSVGNQSDVTAAELLADLADHDQTKVIALYLESFADGEQLFDTLSALRETGKQALLLTVGAGAASSRMAQSHTGSLTSRMDVVDAACRRAGVHRAGSPAELVQIAQACLATTSPAGRRVAVVGDSGGQCGVAADRAVAAGLSVPAVKEEVATQLSGLLPPGAAVSNPVDLAGAGERELGTYVDVLASVLSDPDVDAAVLTGYFGRYHEDVPALAVREREVAENIAAVSASYGKPVFVHTMADSSSIADALWAGGVPVFEDIDATVRTVAGMVALRPMTAPAPAELGVPAGVSLSGYWAARNALADCGVPFPSGMVVRHRLEAVAAAETLQAPYVLKAGWLAHKSEHGGVVLGLADAYELVEAFDRMRAALGDGEYVVEEQDRSEHVVEVLIGGHRDPGLGPVLTLGAGGTEAEALRDTAVELAPISEETARSMIARLRCAPLLDGWRGRPATDIAALAALAAAVSRFLAANPGVSEVELNPVRVGPAGALAVDALIIEETENPND